MTKSLIDRATIARLVAIAERTGDDEFLRSVVDLYVEHTPPLLDQLERAVVANDAVTAKRLAHRIKGSSLSIGATAVGDLCVQLESLCATAPFDAVGAQALAAAMRDVVDRSLVELQALDALRSTPVSSESSDHADL
jgi:HPt (histidine-containing phosphotransfer) domain-containing protein